MKFINLLRFLLTLIFILTVSISYSQKYDVTYSYITFPFEWKIKKIEKKNKETLITLTIKNISEISQGIDFFKREILYYDRGRGVEEMKSFTNHINGKIINEEFFLLPHKEVEFILTFRGSEMLMSDNVSIFIANKYYLRDIDLSNIELSANNDKKKDLEVLEDKTAKENIIRTIQGEDNKNRYLKDNMLTWEEFYNANKKVVPRYKDISEIKEIIEKEISEWQNKGEFETTAMWKQRVNDNSRREMISSMTKELMNQYESDLRSVKEEQISLASDYEEYKNNILNIYYGTKMELAAIKFKNVNFDLMPYDADNQTFRINSDIYGDIFLPVPLRDAPEFKKNWITIKDNVRPEYVPSGDDVALNRIVFINAGKEYVYDNHTIADYSITDVDYNFAPIEIPAIDFASLNIDTAPINFEEDTASTFPIKESEGIKAQNREVPVKSISASNRSNVDVLIPKGEVNYKSNTFAVIIANEDYNSVPKVDFALRDGEILEKYLVNTIGLPQNHVKTYKNSSYGNMAAAIKHIENLSAAYGEDLDLIFYYAGHGVPNEKTKEPMLLPVDGDASIPETCYDLGKLIKKIGEMKSNSVLVLLDACFSGSERGDGMLTAARGVKIHTTPSLPIGNMVIFTASQGDESAYPFEPEQHGMFTYFLLKKLQDNKGDVTLGELSDYIIDNVKRQSVVHNGKLQTPSISVSHSAEVSWRNWKFK